MKLKSLLKNHNKKERTKSSSPAPRRQVIPAIYEDFFFLSALRLQTFQIYAQSNGALLPCTLAHLQPHRFSLSVNRANRFLFASTASHAPANANVQCLQSSES